MAKSLYVLESNSDPDSNGTWKEITNFEYKIGNQYRTIRNGWILHSGEWKQFYQGVPPFEPDTLELVEVARITDRPVGEPIKFGDAIQYETNLVSGNSNEANRVDRVLYYIKYKSLQGQGAFESSDWTSYGSSETTAPYEKKITFSRGDKALDIFEYEVKARVYYEDGEFVETAPKTVNVDDTNFGTTLQVSTSQPSSGSLTSDVSIDANNPDGIASIGIVQELIDANGEAIDSSVVDRIQVNANSYVNTTSYNHRYGSYRYKVIATANDQSTVEAVTQAITVDFSGPTLSFSQDEVRAKAESGTGRFSVAVRSDGGLLPNDPIVSILDAQGNNIPVGANEKLSVVNASSANDRFDIAYDWNPTIAGEYIEATFRAEDTAGNSVEDTVVLIGEGDAPALVAPSGSTTYQGGTQTLQIAQVDETDLTGITLSAQVLQGPATDNDLIIDNQNGTIGLEITEVGDYTVEASATRSYATTTKTPTISVSEPSLPAPTITNYKINNVSSSFTNGQIGYAILFIDEINDPTYGTLYETVSESQAENSEFEFLTDDFSLEFIVDQPEGTVADIESYEISIEGRQNLSQFGFSVSETAEGVELLAVSGVRHEGNIGNSSFGRFENSGNYGDDDFAANTNTDTIEYPLEDQRYKLDIQVIVTNVDGESYTGSFTLAIAGGQTWNNTEGNNDGTFL